MALFYIFVNLFCIWLLKKKRKLASYALYIQTVLITHIVHLWKTLQLKNEKAKVLVL